MPKLIDRGIKKFKLPEGPWAREVPDALLPGLYLVIQPTGAKSWCVRYRHQGKPRKLTLGKYPAIGVNDARGLGVAALRSVAAGNDPAGEKIEARRAEVRDAFPSVARVFIERYAKPKNKTWQQQARQLGLGPSRLTRRAHRIEDRLPILRDSLASRWAAHGVASITKRDIIELLDEVRDARGGIAANRMLAILRKFFSWCLERDLIPASPAAGISPPAPERSRERVLSDEELRLVWKATETQDHPLFGPFVQLSMILGQRRSENVGIRDDEINGDQWEIPARRTKTNVAHIVPLPRMAHDLIDTLPRVGTARLLFSTTGVKPASGFGKWKHRLDMILADDLVPHWTLHDLRRTMSSGMGRLGVQPHIIEACLNHRSGVVSGVSRVYNRFQYLEEKREAFNLWADHLSRVVR